MKIETLVLGPVSTNCYVVSKNGKCLIIDPADRADRIIDHLKRNSLECEGILLTHGHFDHISATDELVTALKAPYYIHKNDEEMLSNVSYNASYYFGDSVTVTSTPRILYSGGVYTIGSFDVTVIETPGHSKGSVSYKIENNLFAGDLLFYSSCGRTDLHGGDVRQIVNSIAKITKELNDDTVIYPGHDTFFTFFEAKNSNYIVASIIK